jgi:hypothetical protein
VCVCTRHRRTCSEFDHLTRAPPVLKRCPAVGSASKPLRLPKSLDLTCVAGPSHHRGFVPFLRSKTANCSLPISIALAAACVNSSLGLGGRLRCQSRLGVRLRLIPSSVKRARRGTIIRVTTRSCAQTGTPNGSGRNSRSKRAAKVESNPNARTTAETTWCRFFSDLSTILHLTACGSLGWPPRSDHAISILPCARPRQVDRLVVQSQQAPSHLPDLHAIDEHPADSEQGKRQRKAGRKRSHTRSIRCMAPMVSRRGRIAKQRVANPPLSGEGKGGDSAWWAKRRSRPLPAPAHGKTTRGLDFPFSPRGTAGNSPRQPRDRGRLVRRADCDILGHGGQPPRYPAADKRGSRPDTRWPSPAGRGFNRWPLRPWRNWIAHRSSEPRVAGSNPAGRTDKSFENNDLQSGVSDSAQADPGACTAACTFGRHSDEALAEVVAAWPALPEHVKLAVLALIKMAQ